MKPVRREVARAAVTHRAVTDIHGAVKSGRENPVAGLPEDMRVRPVELGQELGRIARRAAQLVHEPVQGRHDQRRAHAVSDHVRDQDAHLVLGKREDVEEIAADQPARKIEMAEPERRLPGRHAGRIRRALVRKKRELNLPRHPQVVFHLEIFLLELPRVGLQLPLGALEVADVQQRQHDPRDLAVRIQVRRRGNLDMHKPAVPRADRQFVRPRIARADRADHPLQHRRIGKEILDAAAQHVFGLLVPPERRESRIAVLHVRISVQDGDPAAGILDRVVARAQLLFRFLAERHIADEETEKVFPRKRHSVDGYLRREDAPVLADAAGLDQHEPVALQRLTDGRQKGFIRAGKEIEDRLPAELFDIAQEELDRAHVPVDDLAVQIGDQHRVIDALQQLLEIRVAERTRAGSRLRDADHPAASRIRWMAALAIEPEFGVQLRRNVNVPGR